MKKRLLFSVLLSFIFVLGSNTYAQGSSDGDDDPTYGTTMPTPEEVQRNFDEYEPTVGRSNLEIPANWNPQSEDRSLLDSRGTDFWLLFMNNLVTPTPYLDITSEVDASGTVTISGISFSLPFNVLANTVTRVDIPAAAEINSSGTIQTLGVHVVSDNEVTVYGMNRASASTDGFLGLPVDILGTNYLVMTYVGFSPELGIVSPYDNNLVTVTPVGGSAINFTLNQGETYLYSNGGDLTGSIVASTLPVAVFSGNDCANIPVGYYACDHICEQIPPVSTWGTTFVTRKLEGRINGDTWRFMASQNGTQVMVNGAATGPVLNFGDFYETILTTNSFVSANHPILAVQFSNGQTWDGVLADPFMMIIPPYQQFLDSYGFSTPVSGFSTNYFNSAVETSGVSGMLLDGSTLSPVAYDPIGATGYSAAGFSVAINTSHNIDNSGGSPSGLYLYGFGSYDSYGYPGGLSLLSINTGSGPVITIEEATLNYFCTSLSSGVSLDISALITDPEVPFVQSATLFYRTAGDVTYTPIAMTMGAGDVWTATVPAGDVQYPGIEYYIYATDGQVGTTSPASDPANNPYSVGVENLPPDITHTPVTNSIIGVNVPISADVTDNTNSVQSVELYYRVIGGTPVYTALPMNFISGNNYEASIPAVAVTEQGVDYYIKATDDFGVSCTYGSADDPLIIGTGTPPQPESVPVSNWAIYFGIFLIGLFVIFRFRRRLA